MREAWAATLVAPVVFAVATAQAQTLPPHPQVLGAGIAVARVRAAGGPWRSSAWDDLDRTPRVPGRYEVQLEADGERGGLAVLVPHCAGREALSVDGSVAPAPPGPVVLPIGPGRHEVRLTVAVSRYEGRIACGGSPRVGPVTRTTEGLGVLSFASARSSAGGGRAVVYLPPGHDPHTPARVLVGLHPWNGSMWTYAAYAPLLRAAQAHDVVLLMPSGLGNSLYRAAAEDEAMAALAALARVISVDERAVSIWGASMGGAGATTVAFHRPDRFASVTSFFGDSKYDLSTYVRAILPDAPAAHAVNALDVADNARHLAVWLVHGEDDRTSPIRQSEILAAALRERGFSVRFDRVPGVGHSGALVARVLPQVVALAAAARSPERPARVTYRSVRSSDTGAYGVGILRASARGDAFVDVERRGDAVHVLRTEGVREIVLTPGALGTAPGAPAPVVVDDPSARGLTVRWSTP